LLFSVWACKDRAIFLFHKIFAETFFSKIGICRFVGKK